MVCVTNKPQSVSVTLSPFPSSCSDVNECRRLPAVCPHTRPVCTNTYGHYKCSSKKRCVEGYKPSRDGRACVAVSSRYDSSVSSSPVCPGFPLSELLLISVLGVSGGLSPCR
ncbi:cartilage acidic protein 1-like [Carassius gibelio]|uniref:cartilage acidic protein 1-like n=1 Tax=Carassius gibelio TaxID=101364 RepID=UPI0022777AE9|nr:cartilage acidic protein 1-like [Carassius gibelio]